MKHEAASCTVGVPRESPAHRRLELLAKMSFTNFSQPGKSKLPPGPCRLGNRYPPGTAVSRAWFLPTQGGCLQFRGLPPLPSTRWVRPYLWLMGSCEVLFASAQSLTSFKQIAFFVLALWQ